MATKALAGKVAIITAGVVINYGSDSGAANDLVSEIGKEKALAIQADAGSVAGAGKIVETTTKQFGKIDILFPNASVLPMKDLESTTEADFDQTIGLNVKGPYFLWQKAAPHLAAGSHIILVSTTLTAASTVAPKYLLYNMTKGAIEQMTRVISKDLARKGICVNAIAPGPTGTDLFLQGKSEQVLKMIAGAGPMNRIGQPEEIADAFAFLAFNDSRWVAAKLSESMVEWPERILRAMIGDDGGEVGVIRWRV